MSLAPGSRLGPYEILAPLGAGGMGEVYRARDGRLGREVAIKVLPAELAADPERLERFGREARAAAALNHPNILAVHDLGTHDGAPFLVCELLDGETLRERLRAGRPAPEAALGWALQLARGIAAAHARGIVHRDLKLENLILTRDGQLKILDFGLAKVLEPIDWSPARKSSRLSDDALAAAPTLAGTAAGTLLGTAGYMAPEQARGLPADGRSDVFAFGAIVYELLTGEGAFQRATVADTLVAVLREEPRALAGPPPGGWSPELTRLLRRCLAKRPEERYQAAADLVFDLEVLVAGSIAGPGAAAPAAGEAASIAVLPFSDLSPARDQEYFCDGMAEEILNALCCVEGLRVPARTSSFQFRDAAVDVRAIGQRLGVTHVLEGSVRKAGDRLRINVQLVEVGGGYHVWSERYDRRLEDVFELQDEIAQSVALALRRVLSEAVRRGQRQAATRNVEAYDFYLRGRQFFYQARRKGMEFARQMFERALALDPDYALAWAGLADCSSWLAPWWGNDPEEVRRADEASRRAVELAPALAETHVARGQALALARRFAEAEDEFQTALRLNPGQFEALYFFARACFAQGRLEEAAQLFARAEAVRPEDHQSPLLVVSVYEALGRPADAEAACRRGVAAARRHLDLHPDDSRACYLAGGALVRLGARDEGLALAERALAIDPDEPAVLYNLACVYAQAGEPERALDCLEEVVGKDFGLKDWIVHDHDLVSLRGTPRFAAVLARLG